MDEKTMEPRSNVIEVDIQKEMQKSFLDYSMSVIVSRALPDVRDGLKPVHRRILYSQYEDGLTPDKAYKKCATTVGNVLGRYHPHGDASVYDALVRLAQDFSMHYPLVDGHGNFGSVDGDPPAAYRYTEARMSKISTEMLTDIDKDTVNFIPTTTTAARSRRFCLPGSPTCWSTAPPASPWAWPPTFLPIIWGKPSTRCAT